jgi:hypothetical protein
MLSHSATRFNLLFLKRKASGSPADEVRKSFSVAVQKNCFLGTGLPILGIYTTLFNSSVNQYPGKYSGSLLMAGAITSWNPPGILR